MEFAYPGVLYVVASLSQSENTNPPALTRYLTLIQLASAFAASKELADSTLVVEPNSAAAHALVGILSTVVGQSSDGTLGCMTIAAGTNELGLALTHAIDEYTPNARLANLVNKLAALGALYASLRFLEPQPYLNPAGLAATVLVATSVRLTFESLPKGPVRLVAIPAIGALILKSRPNLVVSEPILFSVAWIATQALLDAATQAIGSRAVGIKIATFLAGMTLHSFSSRSGQEWRTGEAISSGLMAPIAFEVLSIAKKVAARMSKAPAST